jgi:hypothetical protein
VGQLGPYSTLRVALAPMRFEEIDHRNSETLFWLSGVVATIFAANLTPIGAERVRVGGTNERVRVWGPGDRVWVRGLNLSRRGNRLRTLDGLINSGVRPVAQVPKLGRRGFLVPWRRLGAAELTPSVGLVSDGDGQGRGVKELALARVVVDGEWLVAIPWARMIADPGSVVPGTSSRALL